MPIGGFVVQTEPAATEKGKKKLACLQGVEVYASDEKGNIVVVIESNSSDDMEEIVKKITSMEGVFTTGLAYLNAEDEVEKIEKGEYIPNISLGHNKPH